MLNDNKDLQTKIQEYQTLENNLRLIQSQNDNLDRQLSELKITLRELENSDDEMLIYQAIGSIMFQKKVRKVKEELTEKNEVIKLQRTSFKKREEKMRRQLEDMAKTLSQQLQQQQS